ncbi:pimeloyl-CoA dehydrogenase small subunit [Rhizobium sp. CRIBSB]|nr:pimeloyl-CoA dehydrogenase small subunit [Rhizobium sp. CRIBSB]
MNFDLTEDQALLKATAGRVFSEADDATGSLWNRMTEAGLLAAPFAESDGGLGLGAVEMMVLAEEAGAAQAVTPYVSAIVTAGAALRLAPEPPRDLIAAVAEGTTGLAWAHEEAGRDGNSDRAVTATPEDEGWRVSGTKIHVAGIEPAGRLVLTAMIGSEPAVLCMCIDQPGITRFPNRLFDGQWVHEVVLDQVRVEKADLLAAGESARLLVTRAVEHAVAWRAAEAVGLMQSVLDATLDHLKTRRQFGTLLSDFQALRHQAVDMLVALEQARSMAMFAALTLDETDVTVRALAMAQVRSVIGRSSRLVGQVAVQLHGGIGVTEEHPVGRAFRRLTMIDLEMERG